MIDSDRVCGSGNQSVFYSSPLPAKHTYFSDLFSQITERTSLNSCTIDLSLFKIVKTEYKEFKQFLKLFPKDHSDLAITLKISNQNPSFLKYALLAGFEFIEANKNFSHLIYEAKESSVQLQTKPQTYAPLSQNSSEIMIKSGENDLKVPQAPRLDLSFLPARLSEQNSEFYKNEIEKLNPNHLKDGLFLNKFWDLKYYQQVNNPIIVGEIESKHAFSFRKNGVGLRFLDLPIYMPNQGWRIPPELWQFKEVIKKAIEFEMQTNANFENQSYVYITVDQGMVEPHKAQRREGWHGDSYLKFDTNKSKALIACDHVYVVADCCPTPFLPGPFPLDQIDPENIDAVLAEFARAAKNQTPYFYDSYTLLRLDPYCIHDVGFNHTEEAIFRTFVKISFSENKYCKLGNAANNLFTYDWPMVPRANVPYSAEVMKKSAHRKDRDHFLEVNPHTIDFKQDECRSDWTTGTIQTAFRTRKIYAEPAIEGEMLKSLHHDFLVTLAVAKKDDWKVTTYQGEQYFISLQKLCRFYTISLDVDKTFNPKPLKRRIVQLTKDVRFMASWGTIVYAKKGDYLIESGENDIYAIPKALIDEDYSIV